MNKNVTWNFAIKDNTDLRNDFYLCLRISVKSAHHLLKNIDTHTTTVYSTASQYDPSIGWLSHTLLLIMTGLGEAIAINYHERLGKSLVLNYTFVRDCSTVLRVSSRLIIKFRTGPAYNFGKDILIHKQVLWMFWGRSRQRNAKM